MIDISEEMAAGNRSLEDIYELNENELRFLEAAEEFGWPNFRIIHNFSKSVKDNGNIIDINFLSSSRILRYNQRLLDSPSFVTDVGYIGILFQSMKMLKDKVKLIPIENRLLRTVDFKTERFFDLDLIMTILKDIDNITATVELNFTEIYDY